MRRVMVQAETIEKLAYKITRRRPAVSRSTSHRRFVSLFGISSRIVSALWRLLERQATLPRGFTPAHLLWTLCFVKVYATEAITAALFGCDEKTLRKWIWIGLKQLADIDFMVRTNTVIRMYSSSCTCVLTNGLLALFL